MSDFFKVSVSFDPKAGSDGVVGAWVHDESGDNKGDAHVYVSTERGQAVVGHYESYTDPFIPLALAVHKDGKITLQYEDKGQKNPLCIVEVPPAIFHKAVVGMLEKLKKKITGE